MFHSSGIARDPIQTNHQEGGPNEDYIVDRHNTDSDLLGTIMAYLYSWRNTLDTSPQLSCPEHLAVTEKQHQMG